MKWKVDIKLRSGNILTVDDLKTINNKNPLDSSIIDTDKFHTFHLSNGQHLTFIGDNHIITLSSTDIEYLNFTEE